MWEPLASGIVRLYPVTPRLHHCLTLQQSYLQQSYEQYHQLLSSEFLNQHNSAISGHQKYQKVINLKTSLTSSRSRCRSHCRRLDKINTTCVHSWERIIRNITPKHNVCSAQTHLQCTCYLISHIYCASHDDIQPWEWTAVLGWLKLLPYHRWWHKHQLYGWVSAHDSSLQVNWELRMAGEAI